MSETKRCRDRLREYMVGDYILDLGFGGSSCWPGKAISMDMPVPYCPSLEGHKQILRGDYRNLDFIGDDAMTTVFASHALEDWVREEQIVIVNEWKRVLECGGNLIIVCPDEQVYAECCRKNNQIYNQNHKISQYSLEYFKKEILPYTGRWETLLETPLVDEYSWNWVGKKLP